jgi:DNA polymerase I-like protein with 3'-5' exonuclease and polymerase domains
MEQAVKLEVPNKVDYEKGNNWGEIKWWEKNYTYDN